MLNLGYDGVGLSPRWLFVLGRVALVGFLFEVPVKGPSQCHACQDRECFLGTATGAPERHGIFFLKQPKSFARGKSRFGRFYASFFQGRKPQGLAALLEPAQVTPRNAGGADRLSGCIQTPNCWGFLGDGQLLFLMTI